jgi:3-deoxy-D-manno-octulosonate 8-phosphate phosphatase KdsC-like HAD superfamily phosphatase
VKDSVHFVSSRPGGHGAAREFIELILQATGRSNRRSSTRGSKLRRAWRSVPMSRS